LKPISKVVLIVEYDGSSYHGSQYQSNASSVQGEIENALCNLTGEQVRVHAASRTDAGVHAMGQVISVRTKSVFSPETWVKALNFYLPIDIAVRKAFMVDNDFDVRRHALNREYRYSIWNRPTRSPLKERLTHFVPHYLDTEAMNYAAGVLLGEHDFAPFCSGENGSTRRYVYKAEINRKRDLITFDMVANSFLTHQVRNTIGGLIQVGLGKTKVEDFWRLARSGESGVVGPAAPARGLCLMKINYTSFPLPIDDKETVKAGKGKLTLERGIEE